jgi:DNA-directed RNA polymerase specialized sigma24 family protein
LLVAAAAGDHDALRWLLDEVAPIVYGFVYARVGGDDAAAEDRPAGDADGGRERSVQLPGRRLRLHVDVRHRPASPEPVLRVGEKGRGGPAVPARRRRRQGAATKLAGTAELVERQDEVVRALGRLPALQRQVLVMKYLEDMPVQDIAAVVKRSRVQVQSLLQRGRDGLRRELGGQDA